MTHYVKEATEMSWTALEGSGWHEAWNETLEQFAAEELGSRRSETVPEQSFPEFCEEKGVSLPDLARLQAAKLDYLCMSLFKPAMRYTISKSNRHAMLKRDAEKLKALEEEYKQAVAASLIGKKRVSKALDLARNADRAYVRVRYRRKLMEMGVPRPTSASL